MAESAIISRLNQGDDPSIVISGEFPKWDNVQGTILEGLIVRRAKEVVFALEPSEETVLPLGGC